MSTDCTNCGFTYDRKLSKGRCPECGTHYVARGRELQTSEKADSWQCEYRAGGERCNYVATMSTSTLGGGPWYCRDHFGLTNPALGAQIVERSRDYVAPAAPGDRHPAVEAAAALALKKANAEVPEHIRKMHVDECRAEIKRILANPGPIWGGKQDGLAWARKIMDRHAAGDKTLPIHSYQLACEALGVTPSPPKLREPGQDEQENIQPD